MQYTRCYVATIAREVVCKPPLFRYDETNFSPDTFVHMTTPQTSPQAPAEPGNLSDLPVESLIRVALGSLSKAPIESAQAYCKSISDFHEGSLATYLSINQRLTEQPDAVVSDDDLVAMRAAFNGAMHLIAQCNHHVNERIAHERVLTDVILNLCASVLDSREVQDRLLALRVSERARTVDVLAMLVESLNGRLDKADLAPRVQAHTDQLIADENSLRALKQERQASSVIRRIMRQSRERFAQMSDELKTSLVPSPAAGDALSGG